MGEFFRKLLGQKGLSEPKLTPPTDDDAESFVGQAVGEEEAEQADFEALGFTVGKKVYFEFGQKKRTCEGVVTSFFPLAEGLPLMMCVEAELIPGKGTETQLFSLEQAGAGQVRLTK